MGDSSYSELKSSFSGVPAKALNCSSRLILSNNLDIRQQFTSEKGLARDYRGIAELIGLQYHEIRKIEESPDRTMKVLEIWETRPEATVDKLFGYLEDMDRHDAITELIPTLKKDCEEYFKYKESLEGPIQVNEVTSNLSASVLTIEDFKKGVTSDFGNISGKALTIHDLNTGELTLYDVYLSHAIEDIELAQEFAKILESKGLKLFISARDMLSGCFELDAEIELILHRCRRMLLLLTPNFMVSPALEFQVSFAGRVSIDQRQRILIPVILAPCEIHPVLSNLSKLDFTNENTRMWMWPRLFASLQPEYQMSRSSLSLGRNPLNSRNVMMNSACSVSSESMPEVTFPQTEEHNLSCKNEHSIFLNVDETDTKEKDVKDSEFLPFNSTIGSTSKKSHPFATLIKTLRKSSVVLPTQSTSGYYSESS